MSKMCYSNLEFLYEYIVKQNIEEVIIPPMSEFERYFITEFNIEFNIVNSPIDEVCCETFIEYPYFRLSLFKNGKIENMPNFGYNIGSKIFEDEDDIVYEIKRLIKLCYENDDDNDEDEDFNRKNDNSIEIAEAALLLAKAEVKAAKAELMLAKTYAI